ncbi:MAG TPA: hypothetical protein PKV75_01600 [Desulfobacterales bacterium]|nr:hypothetical protein [Desulfobacterales bacterium]
MNLWTMALAVFCLNLPFGFWRAGVKKFAFAWFLAIHLPVPLILALRLHSGIGWQLITFPVLIVAFFTGQFLGGKLHLWWKGKFLSSE